MVAPIPLQSTSILRRLRFSLRAFLLGIALFSATLAWWVTWPSRTARDFCSELRDPITEKQLVSNLHPMDRGIADAFMAHQEFIAELDWQAEGSTDYQYSFAVTRGKIHRSDDGSLIGCRLLAPRGNSRDSLLKLNDIINARLHARGDDTTELSGS